VQAAILDVARFWLDRGVDGFRLDVINFLFHDVALTDNPPVVHDGPLALPTLFQRHIHDRSRPETLGFVARLRAVLDAYPDRMSVGEVVDDPALPRQIEYTAGDDRLHTAYSFHLLSAPRAPPELFVEAISSWADAEAWPSWSLGNHDVARFASRLAGDDPIHARVLIAVLLALPGTIFLYQGEELGLPQAEIPFERLADPFAIAAWTGGAGRDGARTPMPWTAEGPNAGFSTATETWLPLDPRHYAMAVDRQLADERSMLAFTRRLVALRAAHPALRLGAAEVVSAPDGVLAFRRVYGGEALLCVFELGGEAAEVPVRTSTLAFFSVTGGERIQGGMLRLPAFGGAILRLGEAA
ncbi:MAG TPA: alpha-amylase family glycosyl hydrolase, partial [Caulobacteraceae bacterium]